MVIEVVKTLLSAKLVFFTNPGKGAFCVLNRLDCNSAVEVMQGLSAKVSAQNLQGNKQRKNRLREL
jgi:hypothetical protein